MQIVVGSALRQKSMIKCVALDEDTYQYLIYICRVEATYLTLRHDLRSTWASWHVQEGTQLTALKELGGWKSYEMVLRYAHLALDHVASYAENIV